MLFRMPLLTLSLSQQPQARMSYLRPMGKLWRAKAAIMLKSLLKILLVEIGNDSKVHLFLKENNMNTLSKVIGKYASTAKLMQWSLHWRTGLLPNVIPKPFRFGNIKLTG